MKNIVLFISLIIAGTINLAAQNTQAVGGFKTAIEYNDYIISEQNKVVASMNLLSQAVESGTYLDMDKALDSVRAQTKRSLKVIKGMDGYNNNTALKSAAVKLFSFYCKISKKEFKKMVGILKKGDKIKVKDMACMEKLSERISSGEMPLDDIFAKAQEDFAKENNFTLNK
jgi:hypothetical protein